MTHVTDLTTPCKLWLGCTTDGYGLVRRDGRTQRVHRLAFEREVGPIPDGLQLDHLCRQRNCTNVLHLEVVTQRENILRGVGASAKNARKTHCLHGHLFDLLNTYYYSRYGKRACRACNNEGHRVRYNKKKGESSDG